MHYDPVTGEPSEDQSKALPKKLPQPGGNYNSEADAFYHPQPEADWTLNTTTYLWEAPEEVKNDSIKLSR